MGYKRLDLKNGAVFDENTFKHLEDAIELSNSILVSSGIRNLCDPSKFKSGYNDNDNANHKWGSVGTNEVYNTIFCDTELNTGDIITCWNKNGSALTPRFISAYDADKNKLKDLGGENVQVYEVPEGVKFISASFANLSDVNNVCVQRANTSSWLGYVEPLKELISIDSSALDLSNVNISNSSKPTLHVYLPNELCIPQGKTVELYNRQACLEWDRYHIQWIGKYGTSFERKYSITAGEDQAIESFDLTMNVLNDNLEILKTCKCKCHIVPKDITNNQVLIPIGDSLTNNKYWQKYLKELSGNKISFRGTRGHKTINYVETDYNHEGRSGAGTGWYNSGTSVYDFDKTCTPALTDSHSYDYIVNSKGETISPVACNPFWHRNEDGSINKFDFDFYCNSKTDGGAGIFFDASGVEESITPTGVIIYLGANGIALDPTNGSNNIAKLVELIRQSTKGATIPIYIVNDAFRAPYIAYTNADGFNTNTSGEYGYLNDLKHMNLETALYEKLKNAENVFFMPICATFDSEYNYPYTEVGVNPYLETIKMRKYSDTQHPSNASPYSGYKQMAVTMYGVISKYSI